jgi:hypothetical protein
MRTRVGVPVTPPIVAAPKVVPEAGPISSREAIQILEKATGALVLNRNDHVIIVEALTCLRSLVEQQKQGGQ